MYKKNNYIYFLCLVISIHLCSALSLQDIPIINYLVLHEKFAHIHANKQQQSWLLSTLKTQLTSHNNRHALRYNPDYCLDTIDLKTPQKIMFAHQFRQLQNNYNSASSDQDREFTYTALQQFIQKYSHKHTLILTKLLNKAAFKPIQSFISKTNVAISGLTIIGITGIAYGITQVIWHLRNTNKAQSKHKEFNHDFLPTTRTNAHEKQVIYNTITPESIRLRAFKNIARFIPNKWQMPAIFSFSLNNVPMLTVKNDKNGITLVENKDHHFDLPNNRQATIEYEYCWQPPFKTYRLKKIVTYEIPKNIVQAPLVFTSWDEAERKRTAQYQDHIEIVGGTKIKETVLFDETI